MSLSIPILPINTAPVDPGRSFGPVLLSPGADFKWTLGEWDGEGWFDLDGFALAPTLWGHLPALV